MTTPAKQWVEQQLSVDERAQLEKLPPATRVQLFELMEAAVRAKDQQVAAALDNAVRIVPAPLRRSVKKLLAGSK